MLIKNHLRRSKGGAGRGLYTEGGGSGLCVKMGCATGVYTEGGGGGRGVYWKSSGFSNARTDLVLVILVDGIFVESRGEEGAGSRLGEDDVESFNFLGESGTSCSMGMLVLGDDNEREF